MAADNEVHIDPALYEFMGRLAPGVLGYSVDHEGEYWVPVIYAIEEGSGAVGRFLDSLPTDRRVVVPNVINIRLAGMLQRRGFTEGTEQTEEAGEIPVWERPAKG